MEANSNKVLYLIYKHFFLLLLIITTGGSLKGSKYEKEELIIDAIFFTFSLFMYLISLRYVSFAKVTKYGVEFPNKNLVFRWEDVKVVFRIHHVYYMKTKEENARFVFPISTMPAILLGNGIGDDSMVQIIDLAKEKYNI